MSMCAHDTCALVHYVHIIFACVGVHACRCSCAFVRVHFRESVLVVHLLVGACLYLLLCPLHAVRQFIDAMLARYAAVHLSSQHEDTLDIALEANYNQHDTCFAGKTAVLKQTHTDVGFDFEYTC